MNTVADNNGWQTNHAQAIRERQLRNTVLAAAIVLALQHPFSHAADDLASDLLFLEFLGMSAELDAIGVNLDDDNKNESTPHSNSDSNKPATPGNNND